MGKQNRLAQIGSVLCLCGISVWVQAQDAPTSGACVASARSVPACAEAWTLYAQDTVGAYEAAVQLLAALHPSRRQNQSPGQSSDVPLNDEENALLSTIYQTLGLLDRAAEQAKNHEEIWTDKQFNEFQLRQAHGWLKRLNTDQTGATLRQWRTINDPNLEQDRQAIVSLNQMQQGDHSGALKTLESNTGFPSGSLFNHYNYAVALVRVGRNLEGLALLDEIGIINVQNKNEQALRDLANLQLGYAWLREQQGATTRPIFKRISLNGPYANKALLGLGWAMLAADGKPQEISFKRTLYCRDIEAGHPDTSLLLFYSRSNNQCRKNQTYPFRVVHRFAFEAETSNTRYARALKYWLPLTERDPTDSTVHEGLLATGLAYAQAGDTTRAEQAYLKALIAYKAQAKRQEKLARALSFWTNDPSMLVKIPAFTNVFIDTLSQPAFTLFIDSRQSEKQLTSRVNRIRKRLRNLQPNNPRQISHKHELLNRTVQARNRIAQLKPPMQELLRTEMLENLALKQRNLSIYQRQAQSELTRLYSLDK